jgi:hypothetical protein
LILDLKVPYARESAPIMSFLNSSATAYSGVLARAGDPEYVAGGVHVSKSHIILPACPNG